MPTMPNIEAPSAPRAFAGPVEQGQGAAQGEDVEHPIPKGVRPQLAAHEEMHGIQSRLVEKNGRRRKKQQDRRDK